MDDRAQASLEYMIIITVLIATTAVVAFAVTNLFLTKQSIGEMSEKFKERAFDMIKS